MHKSRKNRGVSWRTRLLCRVLTTPTVGLFCFVLVCFGLFGLRVRIDGGGAAASHKHAIAVALSEQRRACGVNETQYVHRPRLGGSWLEKVVCANPNAQPSFSFRGFAYLSMANGVHVAQAASTVYSMHKTSTRKVRTRKGGLIGHLNVLDGACFMGRFRKMCFCCQSLLLLRCVFR